MSEFANHVTGQVALFIGTHANDIELGAGGTCAKLLKEGWNVWYCVLTNSADKDERKRNKEEITAAAGKLGIPETQVLVLNFRDAEFTCNRISVGYFREILQRHNVLPDVVFTHSPHDPHPKHHTAYDFTMATFRRKEILCYSVTGTIGTTQFRPQVFVSIGAYYNDKILAMRCFTSQQAKLNYETVATMSTDYKKTTGLDYVEGFEVVRQDGCETSFADKLNDALFQRFWQEILGGRNLEVIYPMAKERPNTLWTQREREGLSRLLEAFARSPYPYERQYVTLHHCKEAGSQALIYSSDILISGGGNDNSFAVDHFNTIEGIRYIVSEKDGRSYLHDKERGLDLHVMYGNEYGERSVVTDIGVLSIVVNPYNPKRKFIGCMGIDGAGTYACYRAITEPRFQQQLMSLVSWPFSSRGFQILISYAPHDKKLIILKDSLHIVQKEPSLQLGHPKASAAGE